MNKYDCHHGDKIRVPQEEALWATTLPKRKPEGRNGF